MRCSYTRVYGVATPRTRGPHERPLQLPPLRPGPPKRQVHRRRLRPTCTRKVRAAAKAEIIATYKPHQIEKAEELIEQGALVPLRGRRHIFLAISSDGTETYRTHRAACNCKAGLKGHHVCKHRIAAHILSLAA